MEISEMDGYKFDKKKAKRSERVDISEMDGFESSKKGKKSKRVDISEMDGFESSKKAKKSKWVDISEMDGFESSKKSKRMDIEDMSDFPFPERKGRYNEGNDFEDYEEEPFESRKIGRAGRPDISDMDGFEMAPRKKTVKRGDIQDFEDKTRDGMFSVPTKGKRKVKKNFKPKKSKHPENTLASDDSDGETSSEEEVPNINLGFEKEFLHLMASLKRKDPNIYSKEREFFERESSDEEEAEVKNESKEEEVKYECPSDIEDFQQVINDIGFAEGNAQESKEQRYIERQMNRANDLAQFLRGEKRSLKDKNTEDQLVVLRDHWSDPNLDPVDRYLRDYILDKKYLQNEDDPMNDELIRMDAESEDSEEEWRKKKEEKREKKAKTKAPAKVPQPKYKFRFQEPDLEFTKRYPMQDLLSVRKPDTRRSEKNKQRRENKHKRENQRKLDIQKHKDTKRKALLDKLEGMISQKKQVPEKADTGYTADDEIPEEDVEDEFWYGGADVDPDDPNFNMDADFDPQEAKEEKKKKKTKKERKRKAKEAKTKEVPVETEAVENTSHPEEVVSDSEPLPEVVLPVSRGWMDQEEEGQDEGPYWDDPDFNMDADYDPKMKKDSSDDEESKGLKPKKGKKDLDEMFALDEALARAEEVLGPENDELQEVMDEYNKLECDMVEGIPYRFKYRDVTAASYGLSVDEILAADDEELTKWCPLENILECKDEEEEKAVLSKYKKKTKLNKRKKYVFHSIYGGKKKVEQAEPMEEGTSKTDQMVEHLGISNDRFKAYGLTSLPRFKRWLAYDETRNRDRNISGIEIVSNDS